MQCVRHFPASRELLAEPAPPRGSKSSSKTTDGDGPRRGAEHPDALARYLTVTPQPVDVAAGLHAPNAVRVDSRLVGHGGGPFTVSVLGFPDRHSQGRR